MCFVNHNRASVEYLRIRNRAGECHTARVVSVIMVDNVIKWFKKKTLRNCAGRQSISSPDSFSQSVVNYYLTTVYVTGASANENWWYIVN